MPIDQTFYVPLSDNCGVLDTFIERQCRSKCHMGNWATRPVRLLVWRPVLEDDLSRLTWESMKALQAVGR